MENKKLLSLLRGLGACEEAIIWVADRNLQATWDECERADWLLWLCGKMVDKPGWPTRRQVVLAACDCAETALKFVPKGEKRPKKAIKTARAWVACCATLEEVRAAAADAATAATAAAADYAAAATAAADAAYAATAAGYAAAATRTKALKRMADIVRKTLFVPKD